MEGIRAGDRSCFERFYDHWADIVYRYACLACGRTAEAEDLTMRVFVAVWQDPGMLRERCECTLAGLLSLAREVRCESLKFPSPPD